MKAGEFLKKERESRGIDMAEIAGVTRISPYFLEAIERDDYSAIPPGPFLKGFLINYARCLDIEPVRVLKLLEQPEDGTESPEKGEKGPGASGTIEGKGGDAGMDKGGEIHESDGRGVVPGSLRAGGSPRKAHGRGSIAISLTLSSSLLLLISSLLVFMALLSFLLFHLHGNPAVDISTIRW